MDADNRGIGNGSLQEKGAAVQHTDHVDKRKSLRAPLFYHFKKQITRRLCLSRHYIC